MTGPAGLPHDPFRGTPAGGFDTSKGETVDFPEQRLRDAGLTDDQLETQRQVFAGMGAQRQAGYVDHAQRASDDDLVAFAEETERAGYTTKGRNVDEVVADLERDPALLPYALETERQAKRPRATLIRQLEELQAERGTEQGADTEGDAAHRVGELTDPGAPTGPEALGDHGTAGSAADADTSAEGEEADPSLLMREENLTPATNAVTGETVDDVDPALSPEGTDPVLVDEPHGPDGQPAVADPSE